MNLRCVRMVARVFISHSSQDAWVARQVEKHIIACGADAFLDERDIAAGDRFVDRIIDIEPHCMELLALLTPWSIGRPWVMFEISCFLHSRKRVVAVHHGLAASEVRSHPNIGDLLERRDILDINRLDTYFLDTYFDELAARLVAAGSGSHG